MSTLLLQTYNDQLFFRPGEVVDGIASWQTDQPPASAAVRLYWGTRGKGDSDSHTVASQEFDLPLATDSRLFRFTLPDSPYSFSGTLISLVWVIELTVDGAREPKQLSIVVSPSASEIILRRDEAPSGTAVRAAVRP